MAERICSIPDCNGKHIARGLCHKHYNELHPSPARHVKVAVPCDMCGVITMKFPSTSRDRRYCSYECRSAHRAAIGETYQRQRQRENVKKALVLHPNPWPRLTSPPWKPPPREPSRRLTSIRVKPRTFFGGYCQACGVAFVSTTTAMTCSPQCAKAKVRTDSNEHKHRRRARAKAAFIAPVYRQQIYRRDKWRCQICHRKVIKTAVAPNPRAPTLDHIIPLSQGGSHEPANIRLACFLCNCRRGDRGGWEQLALIG